MLVTFAHFVYALLGFRVREFPAKSEKTLGHFSLTAPGMTMNYHLFYYILIGLVWTEYTCLSLIQTILD